MKRNAFIKPFVKLLIVILLTHAIASAASAQSQRKYEEHEVIDIGNGMKIEILKYRGEGENEECNVIYYTDKRQTGRRVWEKSSKITEMERAAKLGRDQAKYNTKKKSEIQSTENIAKDEATEINLGQEIKQQPEAQTPKALMKPKKPDPVKTTKPKTYSSKNMNLITAATQMLAGNNASNYSNNSYRKSTDTAKTQKAKTNLPVKTMVVIPVKKDSIQPTVAAKKTSTTTTSLAQDIATVNNEKIIQPTREKPKADLTKDSAQRLAVPNSSLVKKTSLPIDSAKTIKANVIQPAKEKPKAVLAKDSAQRLAVTKNALVNKTSLLTDSVKTITANIIQPAKEKPKAVLTKDSAQRVAPTKSSLVNKTSLSTDSAKTITANIIQPAKEKPKVVLTKDSAQRLAVTNNTIVRRTSLPIDSAKTITANVIQTAKEKSIAVIKKDSAQRIAVTKNTKPSLHTDSAKTITANVIQPVNEKPIAVIKKDSAQRLAATNNTIVRTTSLPIDSAKTITANIIQPAKEKPKAVLTKDSAQRVAATTSSLVNKTSLPTDSAKTITANVIQPAKEKPKAVLTKDSAQRVTATNSTLVRKTSLPNDSLRIINSKLKEPVEQKPVVVLKKDSAQNTAATKNSVNKTVFSTDTIKIAKATIGGAPDQIPKAIYPVQNKSAVTAFDEKASVVKSSGSPTIALASSTFNNKPTSKNIVDVRDTIAISTINKRAPALTTPSLHNSSKALTLNSNKTTATKRGSNAFKPTSVSKKKFVFDSATAIHVAVFAPLYIDDAFTGSDYNLGKTNLPKNILTGLEFYNGVMMAIDSLSQEGVNAEVMIYDTRQTTKTLNDVLASAELNNVGLVIANITNTTELKQFSQFAIKKNIPLISATYPNAVGVTDNPFFVLLNSSFTVHLNGLYKYMQQAYATDKIIAVRRAGATEDYIKNYFAELNKTNRLPLNIKWVDVKENFTAADLEKNLDTSKNNIVFVASPYEPFGLKVVRALSSDENYRCTAIGMPTWDAMKELNGRDCSNVEIVYSTPFDYDNQNINLTADFIKKYHDKYYSRPSDIAFKGYEMAYHFTKLLSKYQANLVNNLSDKSFTLFNQFDIQPVKIRKTSIKPDYLENKKLYFIKKQEGNIKSIM